MEILQILPQQIFKFKCDKDLLKSTLTILQKEKIKPYKVEAWKVKQTHNTRLNKDENYKDIHIWVRDCLNQVKEKLKLRCERIEITSSWGNVADVNQWHWIHSHPNSFMSAILYLTDSNAHTWFSMDNFWTGNDTNLVYPSNTSNIIKLKNQEDDDNLIIHKQPTIAGDLLIFPSTLVHSVDQHTVENAKRYSLSFNAFPCGLIGNFDYSAGIILDVL